MTNLEPDRAAVEKDPRSPRGGPSLLCLWVWLWQSSACTSTLQHQPSADKNTEGLEQGVSSALQGGPKEWGLQDNKAKPEPTEEKDRRLWLVCS